MAEFSIDRFVDRYARRTAGMSASEVRALFAVASRPEVVSLAGGMPYRAGAALRGRARGRAAGARRARVDGPAVRGRSGTRRAPRAAGRADGRGGRRRRPRGHGDHDRRAAGARPRRQDLHRPRRPDRGRGAGLRRRAHRVRRVRAPLPADRPRRGRHDRRPARGGVRPRRPPQVRLHLPELRQPSGCDVIIRQAPAPRRALPRGRRPDRRGQPLRDAPLRGRRAPGPANPRPRQRDLPRHRLEGLLPRRTRGVGARRAVRGPAPGPGQGGRGPLRLVLQHAGDRALLRGRPLARRTWPPWSTPIARRRDAMLEAIDETFPDERDVDAPGGRLLRVGHPSRTGSTRGRCSPLRSSAGSPTCPAPRSIPTVAARTRCAWRSATPPRTGSARASPASARCSRTRSSSTGACTR